MRNSKYMSDHPHEPWSNPVTDNSKLNLVSIQGSVRSITSGLGLNSNGSLDHTSAAKHNRENLTPKNGRRDLFLTTMSRTCLQPRRSN